jgi:Xaa-Pro aminopeptidase
MQDSNIFKLRVKDLINNVKELHPEKRGTFILFAGFEDDKYRFVQESTFYYFTGIQEPAVVLTIDLEGHKTLYVPNCIEERAKWVVSPLQLSTEYAKQIGVDEVKLLGTTCFGYQMHPFFAESEYSNLTLDLKKKIDSESVLFVLEPHTPYGYIEQRLLLQRLRTFGAAPKVVDVSSIIARMRRSKDVKEIELMYKAVEITCIAQEAAAKAISLGVNEAEVQASLEYIMTGSHAEIAFPSIVATGKNSTVLHYNQNNAELKKGDLVVVDIGARYDGYCADITRTYPVSGTFTKRQKEIYNIVLDTQNYIASIAKPGMWLSYKEKPDQSLNHLARAFIKEKGYDHYFPHGIGHFLGLDVHDVGDYTEPLKAGDVITIEPGIYIAEEQIGVRIEDDYWIVKDGVICLSEGLPKSVEDIEEMVKEKFE